ncbi:MAG: hypothetical protein OXC46_00865 [Thaumarchaeota archaeon]|nr:hypothetical protein [Nitrososphaerota archaeon]
MKVKLTLWKESVTVLDVIWLDVDDAELQHIYPERVFSYASNYKFTFYADKKPSRQYEGKFSIESFDRKPEYLDVGAVLIEGSAEYADGASYAPDGSDRSEEQGETGE